MIPITTFAGRTVAVFGLGRSGVSTCRALLAGGATVWAWDDTEATREGLAGAGIPLVNLAEADWTQIAALVLAPGVPLTHPKPHWTVERATAAGVPVVGDVELFIQACAVDAKKSGEAQAKLVAITGTNGKSTTTALIAHVLRTGGIDVQMGGNIGVAILELQPPAPGRVYVVEMSSYQIDLTPGLRPDIGVLLNLSPDHLDRHGSMENYANIKARLVAGSKFAVVGADDPRCRAIGKAVAGSGVEVAAISGGAIEAGWGMEDGAVGYRAKSGDNMRPIARVDGISTLRGRHNAQNAAAAVAVAVRLGVETATIAEGLATFPGLAHRMEEVGRVGRVVFVNDSKATNADSTATALASFPREIFWIAGGLAKEGGITSLKGYFSRISKAYLIGAAAPEFAATLAGEVPFVISETLTEAFGTAAEDAAASSGAEPVVLLSPACASFDQFRSFEARGDAFREMAVARSEAMLPAEGTDPPDAGQDSGPEPGQGSGTSAGPDAGPG